MGPAAITWPDLSAWCALTRRTLAPWEFDVLARLDNEFFAASLPEKTPAKPATAGAR